MGEAPGEQEDIQGLPFVGTSGQVLSAICTRAKVAPEKAFVTNILKCRPPQNRPPKRSEIKACLPLLHEQISQLKELRVIVTLGKIATSELSMVWGSMGALMARENLFYQKKLEEPSKIPIIPVYHPSYLLRKIRENKELAYSLVADSSARIYHAWDMALPF